MNRFVVGIIVVCASVAFVYNSNSHSNSKKSDYVIGDNFSVWMPETPTQTTSTNDEGLPKTTWEVKHIGATTSVYYNIFRTCYREVLNPDDELVVNDALLILNGIQSTENHRFDIVAKETGRQVPALSNVTKEISTGNVIQNVTIVDGSCMVQAGARVNGNNAGEVARFLTSIEIFK